MSELKSISEHIDRHKDKQFVFYKNSKYYKDEKNFIILRPLSANEYWLETSDGEGTGVAEGLLYECLNEFFRKVM